MARIKITAYIDTNDLEPEDLDLDDRTGVSAEKYEEITEVLLGYDDIAVELVD